MCDKKEMSESQISSDLMTWTQSSCKKKLHTAVMGALEDAGDIRSLKLKPSWYLKHSTYKAPKANIDWWCSFLTSSSGGL
jgi:hypothetical protein